MVLDQNENVINKHLIKNYMRDNQAAAVVCYRREGAELVSVGHIRLLRTVISPSSSNCDLVFGVFRSLCVIYAVPNIKVIKAVAQLRGVQ